MNIKSILGKMFVNDKQIVVLDDTAENGGIESGSTAEGSYIKFPDGTLIQRGVGLTNAAETTYAFPLGFFSTDFNMSITALSSALRTAQMSAFPTVTHFKVEAYNGTVLASVNIQWIAIGRWK